ncbi:GAF domain-containing protein [Faunimonas pinastri]|uniref:GAF domain-containing protein n=1 Tax=Faunimonas pinastri TaxID=1855383 RepID=A0A1H9FXH9_9HYPH|nr:GAF domain-containing protein [Faunimonas pinastri]SEQ42509.1 GAF domain-containing protein [Faunimonas pinastri]
MFALDNKTDADKPSLYADLAAELGGLLSGERDFIANAANAASLLFHRMPDLNWAGFYLMRGGELVLGPFHGKPACVRIAVGKGVCGTAVEHGESVVVPDVHAFPGHIACDAASRSELVVPLRSGSRIVGVLDLDSPVPGRFDEEDRRGCEKLATILMTGSDAFA